MDFLASMIKKLQPENYGQNPQKIALIQVIVSKLQAPSPNFIKEKTLKGKNIFTREMLSPCSL